jgi:hypothetical protein
MSIRIFAVIALASVGLAGLQVPAAAQSTPEPERPAAQESPDAPAPSPGPTTQPATGGPPSPGGQATTPAAPVQTQGPATGAQTGAAKEPAKLPPADSPPLVRYVQIAFPTQGDRYIIEPQTYLYYIQTRGSRPSEGAWVPYNEEVVLADFKRLWATNFLDNLWVEVKDVPFENGVAGKHVIYNLEERQRVKIVDYVGLKKVDQSKIE